MKDNIVIKVGGELLNHPEKTKELLRIVRKLQQNYGILLVHGGGNLVQTWLEQLNLKSKKIDGIRVTPQEHIPYIVGALAGTANKSFCALAHASGLNPVGLSLLDGDLVNASQQAEKFGAVGKVEPKNSQLAVQLLAQGYFPIMSTIACDENGQLLNVNADDGAVVIAKLLNAQLILLSDVPGVLNAKKQKLAALNQNQINILINDGTINGGMVAKVNAAYAAASYLSRQVLIASWKTPELLLNLNSSSDSVGTLIDP